MPSRRAAQPRIVAGRDLRRAETVHVVQADAEFDLPVAQHVRIRRAAGGVFAQKMREYAFTVLGGEAHPMQRNIQRVAAPPRILEVGGGGAVGIVVVLPVGHEEPLDRSGPASRSSSAATAESTPPDMPTMTVPAESGMHGERERIRRLYRRGGCAMARRLAAGSSGIYISICRICDSCMLVCQTSSKKFR